MNPEYPNVPLLQPNEIPYGNNECDAAREQLQGVMKSLNKIPAKFVIANNRQDEFSLVLNQIMQEVQRQIRLLERQMETAKDEPQPGNLNAFTPVANEMRWYRPVSDQQRRTAQTLNEKSMQNLPEESDVLGNGVSNMFNGVGAWFNQTVLQNPTNNYNIVWRRTVGLSQDIVANATQLPTTLRQQLGTCLEQAARIIAPYTNEQGASPARTSSMRSASVRDLSGLTRMFSDLDTLSHQALGNLNPPLVAQFSSLLGQGQELLRQYQGGSNSSYPQAAGTPPTPMTALPSSFGTGTTVPPAVSQWAQTNDTTPAMFLQRVKGWMAANGADASGVSSHLQTFGVPTGVVAWAVSHV